MPQQIESLKKYPIIAAIILTGRAIGDIVYIPRIPMITTDHPWMCLYIRLCLNKKKKMIR